ncbi:MAG: CCA tRNA nucleotidyltransferase, partial [Brevundimonas sp.]
GEPDAEGLEACRDLAPGISRLSAERVSKELMKLLAATDPRAAMAAMARTGVLAQVLPEAGPLELFNAVVDLSDDPVGRLMTLFPVDAEAMRGAAERLRFPNVARDRLVASALAAPAVSLDMTGAEARAAVYRHRGRAVADALLRLHAAAPDRDVTRLLEIATGWVPPRLPVGGREVARLGVPPGPETGRLLKAFEDGWIADDFPTDGHDGRLAALVSSPRG